MSVPNETFWVIQCQTCGEFDCIRFTSDCGYCSECYAVEDYKSVLVNEDNELLEETL